MSGKLVYKNHSMFAIEFMGDWILYVEYAPTHWIESKEIFLNHDDAIAYGKEQIDILLSKALNL
jgi:hypothetical protein